MSLMSWACGNISLQSYFQVSVPCLDHTCTGYWNQFLGAERDIIEQCVRGFCMILVAGEYNLSKEGCCYQGNFSLGWGGWSSQGVLDPRSEPHLLERLNMWDNYSEGRKYWSFNLPCPCPSLRILPQVSWQIQPLLAKGRPALPFVQTCDQTQRTIRQWQRNKTVWLVFQEE